MKIKSKSKSTGGEGKGRRKAQVADYWFLNAVSEHPGQGREGGRRKKGECDCLRELELKESRLVQRFLRGKIVRRKKANYYHQRTFSSTVNLFTKW